MSHFWRDWLIGFALLSLGNVLATATDLLEHLGGSQPHRLAVMVVIEALILVVTTAYAAYMAAFRKSGH
jgi:hypothetical protein